MKNIIKFYILPLTPLIGLFFIVIMFHKILDQEKRPVVFLLSAVVQATTIIFGPLLLLK